ncbi:MAG: signal peptidase II [Ruminococcus sp.]|nr:signal peptidase II [Ruminococcus sp.]
MAILLSAAMILLVGLDQLVKYWAVHSLKAEGSMRFIHFGDFKVIDLTYLENDGAIFGSMSGQKWFLIGFTAITLIAGLFCLYKLMNRSKVLAWSIALFVAGGVGNIIDRIRQGYVVDMFDIKLFKFAIFNVADIYVTVAFGMLLYYGIFIEPKIEKAKKAEAEKAAASESRAESNE